MKCCTSAAYQPLRRPHLSSLFWSANLSCMGCLKSKEGDGKDGEKERRRADS